MEKPKKFQTKKIIGMDGYSDPTSLPEGVVKLIQNMRPHKGGLYTREGNSKYNITDLPSSSGIFGLGMYYPNATTRLELAISNGNLYSGASGTFTQRYSGLSASTLSLIKQFNDKALVVDQTNGILVYNQPNSEETYFAGIQSPKMYRVIDGFETLSDWVMTNGSSANDRGHAVQGLQSIRFYSSAPGGAITATRTLAIDLTKFTDGNLSLASDYISFFLIRGDLNNFSTAVLNFYTNADHFSVNLHETKTWLSSTTPYGGITFRIRKSDFISTGSPTWSNITSISITTTSAGGKSASLICDFLRLEKSGPIVYEYNKVISNVEPSESPGWTESGGGSFIFSSTDVFTVKGETGLAIKVTGNSTMSLGSDVAPLALDLTTFGDGAAASTTDDIQIYIGKSVAATIAATVDLKFYSGAGARAAVAPNCWHLTAPLTGMTIKGMTAFSISKAEFHADGTAAPADWSTITGVDVIVSGNGGDVWFDQISMVKHKASLSVADFEPDEVWVASVGTTISAAPTHIRDGSTQSLKIDFSKITAGTNTGNIILLKALDLENFAGTVPVLATDKLGLWIEFFDRNSITLESFTMQLGIAAWAGYATKVVSKEQFASLKEVQDGKNTGWYDFHFPREQWEETAGMDWGAITELRITWTLGSISNIPVGTTSFYLDNWDLVRKDVLLGEYSYLVVYKTADGSQSDASIPTDPILIRGAAAYLTTLPIAKTTVSNTAIPRVIGRDIYRVGGSTTEYRYVTTIDDNITTTYVDQITDVNQGATLIEVMGQPFIPKTFCIHNDQIVIANLTSPDGVSYPSGVMVGEPYQTEIFDNTKFFEIEPNQTSIKWVHSQFGFTFVGKENSIWAFDPANLTTPPRLVSPKFGGVGLLAVCAGEDEFYFLDPKGVVKYNNSSFDIISEANPEHPSSIRNYIDLIPSGYLSSSWMCYYDHTLFVGLCQSNMTPSTSPTVILAWDTKSRLWYVISNWFARCAVSYQEAATGEVMLFGQATSGYLYKAFDVSSDVDIETNNSSTNIVSILTFGDRDFDCPEIRKDYAKIFLFGKILTSSTATMGLAIYADTIYNVSLSYDFQGVGLFLTAGKTKFEIPGVQLGYKPTYLGLLINSNRRWQFRSLVEYVRMEPETI